MHMYMIVIRTNADEMLLLLHVVVVTWYTLFEDSSAGSAFSWLSSWTQSTCKVNSSKNDYSNNEDN